MNSSKEPITSISDQNPLDDTIDQKIELLKNNSEAHSWIAKCFKRLFRKRRILNKAIISSIDLIHKRSIELEKELSAKEKQIDFLNEKNEYLSSRIHNLEKNITRIDELELSCDATINKLRLIDSQREEENRRLSKLEELYFNQVDTGLRSIQRALITLEDQIGKSKKETDNYKIQQSILDNEINSKILKLQNNLEENTRSQALTSKEIYNHSLNLQNNNLIIEELHKKHQLEVENSKRFKENFDPFYSSFEEQYRGSRREIVTRLKGYENLVQQTLKNLENKNGKQEKPIAIDLGCGRGEWLEVLENLEFEARGADTNQSFVRECQASGYNVELHDALEYISKLSDNSIAVASAFHLVEHLEFDYLLILFKECYRILKPGGLLLFETPNPENLFVSTRTFYLDPTHRNPIPPDLLEFCSRYSGFKQVSRKPSSPYPPEDLIPGKSQAAAKLNELLFGPQDYAIVSWK